MARQIDGAKAKPQKHQSSFNGKVAGIAISLSSLGLSMVAWQAQPLGPITIFLLGTMAFGLWAFCDEMGIEKPLIRAGLVAFWLAVLGRVAAILGSAISPSSAYILYAIAASISILLWSVAFLHRSNIPKLTGLVGAIAGFIPVIVFVLGHILVGTAIIFGSASVLAIGAYPEEFSMREVEIIDYLLSAWGIATAWLLLTGRIVKCSL